MEQALDVCRQWREAFGRWGFAHVVGHGVPDEHIEECYAAAERFFALPMEDKLSDCVRAAAHQWARDGATARGITRPRDSRPSPPPKGSGAADGHSGAPARVHHSDADLFPRSLPELKPATHRYFGSVQRLLQAIMEITAVSVGMPRSYFARFWGADAGAGGTSPHNILRLAHYRSQAGMPPRANQLRYGEHTDFQGYTLLWQDHNANGGSQTAPDGVPPKGGLQVRDPQTGAFLDAPPPPKAFTVNAGDLIQCWTNDVLLSNTHRVANPPAGDGTARVCLVFFAGPHPDTIVECLPTCTDRERPPRHAPVKAGATT
uniref:Fe2OG dioxygenase domain-containing protein n=1 Tax=Emiliania huxleyi (strain CCMP1516) TaxID=280463 RepID=A0A0D3KIK2_EMIH1